MSEGTNVKIRFLNRSMNPDQPTVFIFTRNEIPTFDVLKDGIAWRTIPDIGKGSSSEFVFPIETSVQAMWHGCNKTRTLFAKIGKRYTVEKDNTGIVMIPDGNALQKTAIEVNCNVKVEGGIQAQLSKDGKVMMIKNIVAYGQKATFILHPKLYWGIASEIQEGRAISSAVLNTDNFFEQDIEGVSSVDVILRGNPKDGYRFYLENQS
jgi:hypothetical protein